MKKAWIWVCLVIFCLGLSGCKYVRLLQFKNQFQHFSQNFVFIKSSVQPGIQCLNPLLAPEDILFLSGDVGPSVKKKTDEGMRWDYLMTKEGDPSDTKGDLVISLSFNDQNKLVTAFYPKQFSHLFSPDFVPKMLMTLGNGRVDVGSRSIHSEKQIFPDDWIPDRHKIIEHLGQPTSEIPSKNVSFMVYTYTIKGSPKTVEPFIYIGIDHDTQKACWIRTTIFGGDLSLNLN